MSQSYYRHDTAPGAILAAKREEFNLSVSDVARHLKLSPAQVEALEEGAYDRLPGRVFVRGFLRNYAKLLGIDPQPLLRTIDHEMPQPAAVEEPPPAPEVVMPRGTPSKWPLYAGFVAVVIVGLLAVYEFGFNDHAGGGGAGSQTDAAANPASTGAPPASESAAGTSAQPSGTLSSTASARGVYTPTQSGAAAPAPASPASRSLPPMPAPGPASALALQASRGGELSSATALPGDVSAPKTGQRALRFKFDIESWVEIRDRNDKVIFSKLNKPGAEETVSGTPPFKLVVGNARGVHLNYDDQPVDLAPHIGVTVARLTLQ